jgi:hypothetical protein
VWPFDINEKCPILLRTLQYISKTCLKFKTVNVDQRGELIRDCGVAWCVINEPNEVEMAEVFFRPKKPNWRIEF